MTPKQERFVQEYLVDLNATQAAIRAGYAPKTAQAQSSRLLSNVMVGQAIAEAQKEVGEALDLDAQYVLTGLKSTIERCSELKVLRTRKGEPIQVEVDGELMQAVTLYDPKAVLKGYELLGRHLGMFKDNVQMTGRDGSPLAVNIYMPSNGRSG